MEKPIHIGIIDDHKIFLEGLVSLLSDVNAIHIIGYYDNTQSALEDLKQKKIDVLITDIDMPDINGIETIKKIKQLHPNIRTIVLSMHQERKIIQKAFDAGANSYLIKNTGKAELINAIVDTYHGKKILSTSLAFKDSTQQNNGEEKKLLSEREIEILKLISQENTQQQIADKLFISAHTVIFHRRNLLLKLEVKNTAGLIKKAIDMGLI